MYIFLYTLAKNWVDVPIKQMFDLSADREVLKMCLAAEAARLRNRPLAEWRSRCGSIQFVTNIYDKTFHGNQTPLIATARLITERIKPILVLILAYVLGIFMTARWENM